MVLRVEAGVGSHVDNGLAVGTRVRGHVLHARLNERVVVQVLEDRDRLLRARLARSGVCDCRRVLYQPSVFFLLLWEVRIP